MVLELWRAGVTVNKATASKKLAGGLFCTTQQAKMTLMPAKRTDTGKPQSCLGILHAFSTTILPAYMPLKILNDMAGQLLATGEWVYTAHPSTSTSGSQVL
jgi:hypothetical protein